MITKKQVTWALRWLVSAGLLGWILTRPELARLGSEMRQLNFTWLLGGLLCAGLSLALGAWRWQACLRALGMEIPMGRLLRIALAASAAGCVSFGALGTDLAKVVLAGRQLTGHRGGVLASIVMDHASALPCVVGMALVSVLAHGTMPELEPGTGWIVLVVVAALAAVGILAARRFKLLHTNLMRMFMDKAAWRGLMIAMFRSVPVWLTYCGVFYCAARAFGVVVPAVGFAGVIAIADGVASLPVTIGGLGAREQAFRMMLGNWYDVPPAAAVALSLTGFSLSLVWAAVGAAGFGDWLAKPKELAIS